jgi:O-methyltransferase/methyltransferase family protein
MSTPTPAQGATGTPNQPQPVQVLMQMGIGFVASAALYTVVKLGVADLLKDGPKSTEEIAKKTGAKEDGIYRVLRALAGAGVFEETAPRTFALTPTAELLQADRADSAKPMIEWICCKMHFDTYSEMLHSVKTGETVTEKVYGMACFPYFEKNPDVSAVFNAAMTNLSQMIVPAVLDAYDFSWLNGKTLVDIGGGHGFAITSILKKYPEIHGGVADLEHVVAGATERIQSAGLAARCKTHAVDFFAAVPTADAYVMKHIIHDWNDEKAITILKNCARAGRGKTRVILIESVIQPGNEPAFAKWLDLEMMLLPGGKERTEAEFAALFEKAGMRINRIVATKSPASVIEAEKI